MKFFIDTSNKKLILAIIDKEKKIVDFSMQDSNNNMVKNTLPMMEEFLKKNKLNWNDIDEYMTTIGPGSYTGVKVAINIIRSIGLVNKINKVHVIDTFKLITIKGTKYTALRVGKNKFYLRNNLSGKIKVTNELKEKELKSITMDYDKFDIALFNEKILNKSFKVLDNINDIKIKYINKF